MTKTSKIILVTVIAASILLGLGYAAIQNITLNISGTAAADPNQASFKVRFTGTPLVSESSYITARIVNDTNATFDVSGLNTKGQKVTVTYDITNESSDLSADLTIATTNSNTEYFNVTSNLAKESIVAGETTTVTVTVELTKVLLTEGVSSDIGIEIIAAPVEPGNEGNSGILDDIPEVEPEYVSLGTVLNDDIGEYVDIGNSFVGTSSTSDDWRILYREGSYVYAIMADYLPKTSLPENTGFATSATSSYSVYSRTGREVFVNAMNNTEIWSPFTNGITGVTATGSPTGEVLMASYNELNGTTYDYTYWPVLDKTTEKFDVYVPHIGEIVENTQGYWLASGVGDAVWACDYSGEINPYSYSDTVLAIRPVIKLPISLEAELKDNVWIIKR